MTFKENHNTFQMLVALYPEATLEFRCSFKHKFMYEGVVDGSRIKLSCGGDPNAIYRINFQRTMKLREWQHWEWDEYIENIEIETVEY